MPLEISGKQAPDTRKLESKVEENIFVRPDWSGFARYHAGDSRVEVHIV